MTPPSRGSSPLDGVDLLQVLPVLPGLIAMVCSYARPDRPFVRWCIDWWWVLLAAGLALSIVLRSVRALRAWRARS